MINLTILHTNDIHGRISQLSRIAARVRQIRAEVTAAGGHCLFVDGGDSEDTVHLATGFTKGSAMAAILRASGCEMAALGNAIPLRYGPQVVAGLAEHFGRPILCANMLYRSGEIVPGLRPFIIKEYDSLSIGFIGLTAPINGYASFGLDMQQPAEVLPELIAQVRAQGARTVILLSHLGSVDDQRVAESISGIDLIIGAHDHQILYPPLTKNGTIIVQTGEYGQYLGRLDLTLDPGTGKIISPRGELIPIGAEMPLDEETEAAARAQEQRAQQLMERQIGTLEAPLEAAGDRECAAGNLLADALLERVPGAQVALVVAGHWTSGLAAGPLTKGALFAANRSAANPARVQVTGAQIEQFLREALKPENIARKLRSLRGIPVGWPHVAGMCVRYSPAEDTLDIQVRDEPLEKDRTYIVAGTDLEFYDFMGYLPLPEDQIEYEVPIVVPEVLEEYIQRHSPLSAPQMGRILFKENQPSGI
jgi:2',3'-cyclic-nucleotide 2'-phosphodiesterase (5'-nucleotidase family)